MSLFHDYRALVLQHFQQMKAAKTASPRLARPTPAKIRAECLAICTSRYSSKDDWILNEFFGESGEKKTVLKAIERCEADKFRPVLNFLEGKTTKPEDKVVELVAWLINFQPRPYDMWTDYEQLNLTGAEEVPDQNNDAQKGEMNREKASNSGAEIKKGMLRKLWRLISGKPEKNRKSIALIAAMAIFVSTGALIYWPQNKNRPLGMPLTGLEKCMYWAGDHYQPVSCSQQFVDTLVIAFDSARLYGLKKITRPDTITQISIGKVHYIKIKGDIEFYTAGGYHPVDPQLRLRPMTDFIFRKYILAKHSQINK